MPKNATTEKFAEILTDLIADKKISLEKLGNEIGVSKATLSKYTNNEAEAPIGNIVKLAKYFNVSTDYLLGVSSAKTNDKDLQFICDYTGLSAEAIETLVSRKDYTVLSDGRDTEDIAMLCLNFEHNFNQFLEIQSDFICSEYFTLMLENMHFEKILSNFIVETIQKVETNTFSETELSSLNMIAKAANRAYNRHRLNLFNVQDTVISYLKEISEIEEIGQDRCRELEGKISLLHLNHEININEMDGDINGNDN